MYLLGWEMRGAHMATQENGEPGMPREARSLSWRLGEPRRVRCACSLAEGPREGPSVVRMPMVAKTSLKRLGVLARAGCCAVMTEACVKGPGMFGMPVTAKSLSRRLVELGRLGVWSCGSSGEAVPSL